MLDNTVTLPVDLENTGTTTDLVLRRYEESLNRTTYVAPAHSLTKRDKLTFARTLPKQNGNFRGQAKSSFKFTQDMVVEGVDASTEITSPLIIEVSVSLPVGVSAADALIMRQRAIALLDDDANMIKFQEGLEI